jgi:pimeloyl-ACP methyl ester carboxylesterase
VVRQGVVLASAGYGVLMLDARGHGRSAGRAMDFGWYGDLDARAAVDLVLARPDVTGRVALLGLSMGGEEAIGAAAADDRVAAVVAEGATARTAADRRWVVGAFGWRGRLQLGLDRATYALAELLSAAEQPVALRTAAAATAPRPVLLVTAGRVPDEARAARWIAAAAPASTTVWTVPGAQHTGGLRAAPAAWRSTVVRFLDVALRPAVTGTVGG